MHWDSNDLEKNTGSLLQTSYCIDFFFKPFGDEKKGGDRFVISLNEDKLSFYLSDATGHGKMGASFWQKYGKVFDLQWQEFIASAQTTDDIKQFSQKCNDHLLEDKDAGSFAQLCIVVGTLNLQGQLHFANFGYGTHALVSCKDNPWEIPGKDSFGLKMGWLDSESWPQIPKAFVFHSIENVKRIVLMTDCFLGDDFCDPDKTMQQVIQMGNHTHSLEYKKIIPYFLQNFSYDEDDASLLTVEII